MGEELVLHWNKVYGLKVVSTRPSIFLEQDQELQNIWRCIRISSAEVGSEPLTVVGDGTQSRDFTYVTDM